VFGYSPASTGSCEPPRQLEDFMRWRRSIP
jgi:hypothetical protein